MNYSTYMGQRVSVQYFEMAIKLMNDESGNDGYK